MAFASTPCFLATIEYFFSHILLKDRGLRFQRKWRPFAALDSYGVLEYHAPDSRNSAWAWKGLEYRTGGLSRHTIDTERGHPLSTMDSIPHRHSLHKIVILNPKGGSGKTTLATNLASYFAKRGPPPTLVDCDPYGFSMRWLDKRPAGQPKIYGVSAHEHCAHAQGYSQLPAWFGSRQLIVDLPAAVGEKQLYDRTYDADSILIPVVPSEIDIYAAASFIADLLLVAQIDRRDRKLAIVANRTRKNTTSYRMLMRFLTSLQIPIIAQLRDCQSYVHAAARGVGIYDMPVHKVRQDIEEMDSIIAWLDQWRMRKLDAVATAGFQHISGAEVLTPALSRNH